LPATATCAALPSFPTPHSEKEPTDVHRHRTAGSPHGRLLHRTPASADPEDFAAIQGELKRQQTKIELIASENITSLAVLEATGSV
jgi:hypothetical protein